MSERAVLLKLYPNQDLTLGLEAAVRDAGMRRARIVAAVGSLVEGVLDRGDELEIVPGPALEVAALSGEIDAEGGSALRGYFCCDDTCVVEGPLVRGANSVSVTFEAILAEAHAG